MALSGNSGKSNNFSVECNGHTIKAQRLVKYLGLTLDDQLTREAIVNSIVQKVNGRLKFLYRQCNFLEEKLRKSICSALIQCHIDYACSSWYSGLVVKRYIRVGYNLDIMRQSACLVLNPITVYSYGFLFNCTTVGQDSDSMTALT